MWNYCSPKEYISMTSCIQNIVFNILCLPSGLVEFLEYLILNLLEFVLTVLRFNLNSCIDRCLLTLQACKLHIMTNIRFHICSKRTYLCTYQLILVWQLGMHALEPTVPKKLTLTPQYIVFFANPKTQTRSDYF